MRDQAVRCDICDGTDLTRRWPVDPSGAEGGVDPQSFRPSSQRFGQTAGIVVMCRTCGHGFLEEPPRPDSVASAYADAVDGVSLRERAGQLVTADLGLRRLDAVVAPGGLLDVGCWTGSFVEAAAMRGWQSQGIEPSTWAVERAVERGLDVVPGDLDSVQVETGSLRAVVACDVLEHLERPGEALSTMVDLLEPGGALYLTVPDAGSLLARCLGRRWWSVLPMHLQYFTRTSMLLLLASAGLRPAHIGTHAKTFSSRYYAERLAGYSPAAGRLGVSVLERAGLADRLVAPNFRDRMEVIAVRR